MKYPKWKSAEKHNPNFKPWLFPDQMTLPRLNPADILPFDVRLVQSSYFISLLIQILQEVQKAVAIDESIVSELKDEEQVDSEGSDVA